jgi:hypothetical protein
MKSIYALSFCFNLSFQYIQYLFAKIANNQSNHKSFAIFLLVKTKILLFSGSKSKFHPNFSFTFLYLSSSVIFSSE